MKKNVLRFCIFLLCVNVFGKETLNLDYECPKIESQNYYLVDLKDYQNNFINSIEILFNANKENNIDVYGNNPENQKWEKLSQFYFRGFSDKQKKNFLNKNSIKWRYFYIQPDNGVIYNYRIYFQGKTLKCEIRGKNDSFSDIPLPKINMENVFIFDISKYGAEDYVLFRNFTDKEVLTVVPYYFDKKLFKWFRSYETATLKGFADTEKIEIIDDAGIESIRYLALEIEPYDNYTFTMYENHSDLYIEINSEEHEDTVKTEKPDINSIED